MSGRVAARWARWMAAAGLLSSAAALTWSRTRGPDDATWDITIAWLVGVALVFGAASLGRRSWARLRRVAGALRRPDRTTLAGLGITATALALRLVALDRFPSVVDGDEGFFLLPARQARTGDLANPYDTSFFSVPELYRAWQGIVARPFTDSIGSYRILGALVGAATVFLAWRIGRRVIGEAAGLAGAAVLAALPFDLWLSRVALNNVTNGFTLALTILFGLRLIESRHRFDAAVAGGALGLGLYGYYPAAVFPGIALAWLVIGLAAARHRPRPVQVARLTAWAVAGFTAVGAPIIGFYVGNREVFTSRFTTVSSGTEAPDLAERVTFVPRGLLYPVVSQPEGWGGGFYRQGPVFIGEPVAVLLTVGLGVWLWRVLQGVRQRSGPAETPLGLVLAWVIIGLGISQTAGMQSQRYSGIVFVWALAAGTGLVAVVKRLVRLGADAVQAIPSASGVTAPTVGQAVAVVVIVLGAVHVSYWFSEDRQVTAYGDHRTSAGYDLGWRLRDPDHAPSAVRFEGGPHTYAKGLGSLRFLAPEAVERVTDHEPFPLGPDGRAVAPDIVAGQSLVLSAERSDAERCALLERYPDLSVDEARDVKGTVLYTAYAIDAAGRLPSGTSPAGTVLVPGHAMWLGDRVVRCG